MEKLTLDVAEQLTLPGDEQTGEENSAQLHDFIIDNDQCAEWAVGKIKDADDELDRLEEVYKAQRQHLDELFDRAIKRHEQNTAYLKELLRRYFETVEHKTTKAGTETYQLLSCKLVRKPATLKPTVDDDKLLGWLKTSGRSEYIKTVYKPAWGELKKTLTITEAGAVTADGELVEGVTVEETPAKFEVKAQ